MKYVKYGHGKWQLARNEIIDKVVKAISKNPKSIFVSAGIPAGVPIGIPMKRSMKEEAKKWRKKKLYDQEIFNPSSLAKSNDLK